jgi:hypothetical protein
MFDKFFEDIRSVDGERGFDIIPKFLTPQAVETVRAEIAKLISDMPEKWIEKNCVKNLNGEVLVMRCLDTASEFVFRFARHPLFSRLSEQFGKKKTVPLYVEYFNKPAHCLDVTPPHQDQAFYEGHFSDELGITFWIALDVCRTESGCLFVCPTRERVLYNHKLSNARGFTVELESMPEATFTPIELDAGGCLVHGAFTPHFSTENHTNHQRRAIAISYRTSEYRNQMANRQR